MFNEACIRLDGRTYRTFSSAPPYYARRFCPPDQAQTTFHSTGARSFHRGNFYASGLRYLDCQSSLKGTIVANSSEMSTIRISCSDEVANVVLIRFRPKFFSSAKVVPVSKEEKLADTVNGLVSLML